MQQTLILWLVSSCNAYIHSYQTCRKRQQQEGKSEVCSNVEQPKDSKKKKKRTYFSPDRFRTYKTKRFNARVKEEGRERTPRAVSNCAAVSWAPILTSTLLIGPLHSQENIYKIFCFRKIYLIRPETSAVAVKESCEDRMGGELFCEKDWPIYDDAIKHIWRGVRCLFPFSLSGKINKTVPTLAEKAGLCSRSDTF